MRAPLTTTQIESRIAALRASLPHLSDEDAREAEVEEAQLRALLRCSPHTTAETR